MFYTTPEAIVRETSFRNKTMDVRIPFQRTPKGMQDTDETRDKIFGLIDFMKHIHDNAADSLKEAVEKGTVFQKEMAKFLIHGKDTVSVFALDEFKGHGSRAFLSIFNTAGRTKAAFAPKGNKFHMSAIRAGIHDPTIGRVAAVDHFRDVVHFHISGMEGILNNLIIICKNVL